MRYTLFTFAALTTLISSATASPTAEALFDAKCAACHSKTRPADISQAAAPALSGVMRHIKMAYPEREDAIRFMVDYVLEPDQKKAVCMAQKIERFGLMPSQKGNVSTEELQHITAWMYDNFPPKGFRGQGFHGHGRKTGKGKH